MRREQQRFIDCQTYLEKPDVLPRLLLYRMFMHVFADARTPVLQRAGQEWEIQQARRLQETCSRSYRFSESFLGVPILEAMSTLSAIGVSERSEWHLADDGGKFRMAARGGGGNIQSRLPRAAWLPG